MLCLSGFELYSRWVPLIHCFDVTLTIKYDGQSRSVYFILTVVELRIHEEIHRNFSPCLLRW